MVIEVELLVEVDLVSCARKRRGGCETVDAGSDDRDAHARIVAQRMGPGGTPERRRAGPQSPPFREATAPSAGYFLPPPLLPLPFPLPPEPPPFPLPELPCCVEAWVLAFAFAFALAFALACEVDFWTFE